MQWIEENKQDASMLGRIDLSPLDAALAEGDEQLDKRLQCHNKAIGDLTERFEKLALDREELNRTEHWFGHDSKALLAERRRVVAESWDVLVTVRRLLAERHDVLRALEAQVAGKISELATQYDQTFEKIRKALARQHRDYLKAAPVRGSAWVDGLAEDDDTLVALREQIAPLQSVLENLQTLDYRAAKDSALTFRQREVYEQLN